MQKTKYFMYLNAIISSFAVVVAHTITNPVQLGVSTTKISFYLLLCIVLGIIFSYGVPLFFMQSGANVLNYRDRYTTHVFFKKRIHKVIIPFILWSILGFFFIYGKEGFPLTIKNFCVAFLTGNIVEPYWFFYNIIGFYICVPFISLIIKYGSTNIIKYTIFILIIVNTGIPVINVFFNTQSSFGTSVPFIGPYAQYFIAGWYLNNVNIAKKNRLRIYSLAIVMLLFEIVATIYFSFFVKHIPMLNYPDGIVKTFYDIAMFPSFCVMCALFLFLKQLEPKLSSEVMRKNLKKVAGLTFGIYLIHPFIIVWLLNPFNQIFLQLPLIVKMLIDPLFVYCLSGLIVMIVRKIGLLHWIVP